MNESLVARLCAPGLQHLASFLPAVVLDESVGGAELSNQQLALHPRLVHDGLDRPATHDPLQIDHCQLTVLLQLLQRNHDALSQVKTF